MNSERTGGEGHSVDDAAGATDGTTASGLPRLWRGVRWRVTGQAQRAMWLYRGVRWRVIGQAQRAMWLYRGVRWRVIGQAQKAMWLYRGVRWRVIGQARRLMWFGRRRRRQLLSAHRKSVWFLRRMRAASARAFRLSPVAAVGGGLTIGQRRDVLAALDHEFAELAHKLELRPVASGWLDFARDRRLRQMLFAKLPRPGAATRQRLEIGLPLTWDREACEAIGNARFLTAAGVGNCNLTAVMRTVLPVLISGRPVALRDPDVGESADWMSTVGALFVDSDAFFTMSEDELARHALSQLRSIVQRCSAVSDATPEPPMAPTVSIVMSTNRPEFVGTAVARDAESARCSP